MATRKVGNNPVARDRAVELITDRATGLDDTRTVVDLFPSVEFETSTTKVGGEEISLRRVVLTSAWEVVTTSP